MRVILLRQKRKELYMNHHIVGLFSESKGAGEAISELKEKGYTKDISLITKDYASEHPRVRDIKKDITSGSDAGAVSGAAMGGVAAGITSLFVGAVSFVIPGAGLIVLGPLATTLTGIVAGALTGQVVGALVDAGFPKEKAKMYEHQLKSGDTLVSVTTDDEKSMIVQQILTVHGAHQTEILNKQL